MTDFGVIQVGTLGYDGAFTFRLRHWLALFAMPPDGNTSQGRVDYGYIVIFSLPFFWRRTQSTLEYFQLGAKTSWCRPVWMVSVHRQGGKLHWRFQLQWMPLK